MEYGKMEYAELVEVAKGLDFIPDEQTADSAVKAVLSILASRLGETQARVFVSRLPEPLSLDKLRGHEADGTDISADRYVTEVAEEFDLSRREAKRLICSVLGSALERVGEGVFDEIERDLPEDWKTLFQEC